MTAKRARKPIEQFGWGLDEYLESLGGLSRTTYYKMPLERRPKTVWLRRGKSNRGVQRVIEPPREYLERLAAADALEDAAQKATPPKRRPGRPRKVPEVARPADGGAD